MDPILNVRHLEIKYGEMPAVSDVSLELMPGEVLGVVGESGSGKSTLIRGIMGLLGAGSQITEGDICFQGKKLLDLEQRERRKLMGQQMMMIFQNPQASLVPIRTVEKQIYEAISEGSRKRAGVLNRKKVREQALEAFAKIGLKGGEQILKSYPFQLSGGMNQRVCIAIAMMQRPQLLFADEPTSALDVTVQSQVLDELVKLKSLSGTAIVLVTHNIGIVERIADKAAVMYQGRLVEYGSKDEVIQHPREEYTKKLLNAVLHLERE